MNVRTDELYLKVLLKLHTQ